MLHLLLFITITIYVNVSAQFIGQQVSVRTSLGNLAGQVFNYRGQSVYSFLGVPYAQPPVGELRWQPPTLKLPWQGVRMAKQFGPPCTQKGPLETISQEDCLFLNIFSPTIDSSGRLPIMFWIHGGQFERGSASEYPADGILDNLVTKNVIVVTINYRLNAFGLFSLQNNDIRGNYAFLDQLAALTWIRTHIASFGGDYRQITVFGQEAGAISASLLTLSPVSKDIMQRVILQSGGAMSVHPLLEQRNWNVSRFTAVRAGCATLVEWDSKYNLLAMASCLRKRTAQEILRASDIYEQTDMEWGARIDGAFLTAPIQSLLSNRSAIPAIIGINSHDGGLQEIQRLRQSFNSGFESITNNQYLGSFTPDTLRLEMKKLNLRYGQLQNTDTVDKLAVALYSDAPDGVNNVYWFDKIIEARTDALFAGFAYLEAESFLKRGAPVFLYQFTYLSSTGFLELSNLWRGVVNGWENQYIFGRPGYGFMTQPLEGPTARFTAISSDNQMANQMAVWWTNFAKFGFPTTTSNLVQWQAMRLANQGQTANYMVLEPVASMRDTFRPRAVSFWADLVPQLLQTDSLTSARVQQQCYSYGYLVALYLFIVTTIILIIVIICILCFSNKVCAKKRMKFEINPNPVKY